MRHGFSLIELSVVLVIIALVMGSGLSVVLTKMDGIHRLETHKKMEKITGALAGFVTQHKRLPCPADGTLATTNANFGLERFDTGNNVCFTTAPNQGTQAYAGVVPIRTLDLPNAYMLDGWDRRITYVVDKSLAATLPAENFYQQATGGLTISNENNTTITDVATILISHGENGHGAWLANGSTTRYSLSTAPSNDELENVHMNETQTVNGYNDTFKLRTLTTTYDDLLMFTTKSELIQRTGNYFADSTCTQAATIRTGDTSLCVGSADTEGCERLGLALNEVCL